MWHKWRLRIANGWVGAVGVFGAGLLPCPDCGIPLAVQIWPVAGVIWLYRHFRRRSADALDLLITDDLRERIPDRAADDHAEPA